MPPIERIGFLTKPLTIICGYCDHRAVWQPREAQARLGGWSDPYAARRRLKCSRCAAPRGSMVSFSS